MTFTIHRGADKIGGSCVEVCAAAARVVLDIGMPLLNDDGTAFDSRGAESQSREQLLAAKVLPDIPALYGQPDGRETAILISHAHSDHYGLLKYVDAAIPVYISEVSKVFIETNAEFTGKECPVVKNPQFFVEAPEGRRIYKPFTLGGIEIQPYIMDHAIPGAFAFLIKAEGKSLFYTGDFRSHGRKFSYFYRFVNHIAPRNVDWLLMEGTTILREQKMAKSEAALEQEFVKTFKAAQGITFVNVSSHNIDRLVTIYRACMRYGKLFVIDLYVAAILKRIAKLGCEIPHPSKKWPLVRVFYTGGLCGQIKKAGLTMELTFRMKHYRIKEDEISKCRNKIVMIVRPRMDNDIKKIKNINGGTFIFSQWEGYKSSEKIKNFLDSFERLGFKHCDIHTSGHADTPALQKMVNALQPKELVPIHTLEPEKYREIFPDVKVRIVQDGEAVQDEDAVQNSIQRKENAAAAAPMGLLEHLLEISNIHEKYKGLPETLLTCGGKDAVKTHLDFVCGILGITQTQAVLFADIFGLFDYALTPFKELARLMNCKPALLLKYNNDFSALEEKNFISIQEEKHYRGERSRHEKYFIISSEANQSIPEGKCPENPWTQTLSADDFLDRVFELREKLVDRELPYKEAIQKLAALIKHNKHLTLVKNLESYALDIDDSFIVLRLCYHYAALGLDEMSIAAFENVYENRAHFRQARRRLESGEHVLQQQQIIEYVNNSGFADTNNYRLTDKAKEFLLSEFEDQISKRSIHGLIKAGTIPKKELFYPEKTGKQIEELTRALSEEKFQEIQKNLAKMGMRTGFACLFSGEPGTGKTETAYQIARKTGRDIMLVDISESKSMYFGESEKKIKEIFTRYRAAVKRLAITPILLFNEADAVISKRQMLGDYSRGPAQTENAMQNIILQEIENLNGILIATTNLVQNLDKAFDRRFLYKIVFEKPDMETRKALWREHIPDLPGDDIAALAQDFDFSGGQIENIARRRTFAVVLNSKAPSLEETRIFCQEEQDAGAPARPIGFAR